MIHLDRSRVLPFLTDDDDDGEAALRAAHASLLDGSGAGSEFLGWRRLALEPDAALMSEIADVAAEIRDRADVLVCIGIGGSYLGAEAVISALSPYFRDSGVRVVFAGHHLSPSYHKQLLTWLEGKSVYVNVISKSGGTLEPALAFRFVRTYLERRFGDADRRVLVTTGPTGGLLNPLVAKKGFRRFIIPEDVGGRFSVLSPVGLLPIAVAGHDIEALVAGAGDEMRELEAHPMSAAGRYALDRFRLHEQGFTTDLMAVTEPRLAALGDWWQQLFGESEGKDGKGLFPAVVKYTTDLHSVGQYVQEGRRNLVETFLTVEAEPQDLDIDEVKGDVDGLNYLAGKSYAEVNQAAYEGTAAAHEAGGVPNWTISLPAIDERSVGAALAFFQHAVALSGYLLKVNPFDQPGVEAYKQKMFELLGRP